MKTLDELNALLPKTLMGHLAIRFTEVKEGMIVAEMPVDERTMQPFGRLHGGASVALAESVASAGSWAMLGDENTAVYATEVSATHIRPARAGTKVVAVGTLIYEGRSRHIWEVMIWDYKRRPVNISRITNMLVDSSK